VFIEPNQRTPIRGVFDKACPRLRGCATNRPIAPAKRTVRRLITCLPVDEIGRAIVRLPAELSATNERLLVAGSTRPAARRNNELALVPWPPTGSNRRFHDVLLFSGREEQSCVRAATGAQRKSMPTTRAKADQTCPRKSERVVLTG
jgi:hypothetical protein